MNFKNRRKKFGNKFNLKGCCKNIGREKNKGCSESEISSVLAYCSYWKDSPCVNDQKRTPTANAGVMQNQLFDSVISSESPAKRTVV